MHSWYVLIYFNESCCKQNNQLNFDTMLNTTMPGEMVTEEVVKTQDTDMGIHKNCMDLLHNDACNHAYMHN